MNARPWISSRRAGRNCRGCILLGFFLFSCSTPPQQRELLKEYREADFGAGTSIPEVDESYRNRIALEFEIVRSGRIDSLREALRDSNRNVRAFSVAALGILGDRESVGEIAKLLEDPDVDRMVGDAALQALGWLKGGLEAVQSARSNPRRLNQHLAAIAERQIKDSVDHAAPIREAYRLGLRREKIGSARVGAPAPDFTAIDSEGAHFTLADEIRKNRVVILVFVSADW